MNHRAFRELFKEFKGDSWRSWASIEDAIFGVEPMDAALVRKITGRTQLPAEPVSEFLAVVGRGGGKSRFAARLACFFAAGRTYAVVPGERIFVSVVAPDRKQAGITFNYIRGLLRSVPALSALVESERADSIDLSTGVTVEVIAATVASPRGRAYALVVVEEMAFLPVEGDSDPDVELLRAVRPALARVPGSLLAMISSPYAMRGQVYDIWREKFGVDDPDTLVVQADTATLNPSFSAREITRAYKADPVAAAAEYGANFRQDVSTLLLHEAIAAVVPVGVRELPPDTSREMLWHNDAATGSGEDSWSLAGVYVGEVAELAVVREWTPPFNPSEVAAEVAAVMRRYGHSEATIDKFAPNLIADLLGRFGISCRPADGDTSQAFAGVMALINAKACRLLDHEVLLQQLRGLERRTKSGGRDQIGHRSRAHDDVAASAAFALVAAAHAHEVPPLMLMGGDSWYEWQAAHGLPDGDEEDETDGPIAETAAPGLVDRVAAVLVSAKDALVEKLDAARTRLTEARLPVLRDSEDFWVEPSGNAPWLSKHLDPKTAASIGLMPRSTWKKPKATKVRRRRPRNEVEDQVQTAGIWFPGDLFIKTPFSERPRWNRYR